MRLVESPVRILLVDDSREVEELARFYLRAFDQPWELLYVPDCLTAQQCLQSEAIDLILMDQKLPGVSGTHCMRQLRRDLGFEGAIVMITGLTDDETISESIRYGADDYVSKANLSTALTDKIKSALGAAAARARAQRRVRVVLNEIDNLAHDLERSLERLRRLKESA